jgi:hypothetical protein
MTKKDTGLFSSIRESLVKPRRIPQWFFFAALVAIGATTLYKRSERARVTREQWSSKKLPVPDTIEYRRKVRTLITGDGLAVEEHARQLEGKIELVKFGSEQFEGPLRARSLNWLGNLYAMKGVSDDAEQAYRQALVMYEKNLGSDHEYAAIVRDNLDRLLAPPK